MSLHSAACCTVPPVVAKDYSPKGKYTTVDGLKTYHTGESSAKHGIFVVYDIFGFFPQTIQGADILAYGNKDRKYQVFMPDFFDGKPADISWYPPDNEEKGKKLGAFFEGPAAPPKTVEKLNSLIAELKKSHSEIESWGIVGYCWGGKIVNLVSQAGTPFKAAAACHPAMVDPADAPKVTIPIALLPSQDEDKDAVAKYEKALTVKHTVEWFPTQIHGWMAARSDLEDPKVKSEYERGYKILLDFYHENS
ncbi:carboxymethylenebutenolidase [Microthyrium microscopicum]|uniref:Carboxymethylenebutenolidase n=1 Tax=Microthyrium microscopicum TaxID=703497 RepID=A0A6A6UCK5_9PEZI|nr:carboxymethylenebutenolidase [Microthyrium microscopicum]